MATESDSVSSVFEIKIEERRGGWGRYNPTKTPIPSRQFLSAFRQRSFPTTREPWPNSVARFFLTAKSLCPVGVESCSRGTVF